MKNYFCFLDKNNYKKKKIFIKKSKEYTKKNKKILFKA